MSWLLCYSASNVTDQDNCGNHDCQNDGTCQQNDTVGYTCICTEEYGGHFCEVKLGNSLLFLCYNTICYLHQENACIHLIAETL